MKYFLITVCALCCALSLGEIVVRQLDRMVDLTNNVIRVQYDYKLSYSGDQEFFFILRPEWEDNAMIVGQAKDNNGKLHTVLYQKKIKKFEGQNIMGYEFDVKSFKPTELIIRIFLLPTNVAKPLPKELKQGEKQYLLYVDSLYDYAPYTIKNQTLTVKFSTTTRLESYTKTKDATKTNVGTLSQTIKDLGHSIKFKTLNYGPFDNVRPYSKEELTIHYEHDVPITVVTNLNRDISVSHWGMISVKEDINIENKGAQFKLPFSRFRFQQPGGEPGIALTSFQTILPAYAQDLYYKDEIGNISTSNVRVHHYHDSEAPGPVEILIRPRFPLFGGWKTFYILGYSLPTFPFLSYESKKSAYRLKMRFVDHIYHDQIIEKANVKVILPEGSKILKVDTPYPLTKGFDLAKPLARHYTYLDTVGRPVLELSKENLIDEHIQDFVVEYKYPTIYMLQEPLLLITAYFLLFCIVMIYVRLDFSITKDEISETKLRISGQMEKLKGLQEERASLYDEYVDCINKFKADKDLATFTQSKKKIESDLKKVHQKMSDYYANLKVDSPDLADRVSEIQSFDKTLKEQVMPVWVSNAEKAVSGKMSRQLYVEAEKISAAKKTEILDKMAAVLE